MSVYDPSKPGATAPPPYSQYPGQNPGYPPMPQGYGPYHPEQSYPGAQPAGYGFQPPPQQPGYAPGYGTSTTVITVPPIAPEVIILNGCPTCRNGVLEEDFTCCGIMCGILFFPLGLLCCWMMRERRCSNCRTQF